MEVQLKSEITCPNCGHKKIEEMPINACQFFYKCENCKEILKPKEGDCCIYCSYGQQLVLQFKKTKVAVDPTQSVS